MESLTETELIRARWRRHLRAAALDATDRNDFAHRGLAAQVEHLALRLLLLPLDPDHERHGTSETAAFLQKHHSVDIGNGSIHFGSKVIPTAHSVALVHQNGDDVPWNRFVSIHRAGAIELALGDRHRENVDQHGNRTKIVRLVTAASFTWATLELARELNEESQHERHLLAVALPDTNDAHLTNLGAGYVDKVRFFNETHGCLDEHLLWHIELDRLPANEHESGDIARKVGERIVNAWGWAQTLHLDSDGPHTAQLDVHRSRQ